VGRLQVVVVEHPPAATQPSPELEAAVAALAERVTMDGTYDTSFKVMSKDEVVAIANEILSLNLSIRLELQENAVEQELRRRDRRA
jgi:hypothetical protein